MSLLLKKQNAGTSEPPFGIYHGTINERDDGPIEICVPVSRKVRGEDEVAFKQLAGGNCASVTLTGKQCQFPEILGGYDAVVDWIHHNGYQLVGAPREVWASRPGEEPKMEIQWLFK
jgi:effector-binding domain-containing protein